MWYRDSLALITDVTLNSPIFLSCLFLKVGVNPPIKLNQGFDKATARSKNFNRALMLNAVSRCHSIGTELTAAALYSDTAADQNVAERSSDASIRGVWTPEVKKKKKSLCCALATLFVEANTKHQTGVEFFTLFHRQQPC